MASKDEESERFHCYGCGRSGDIFDAVQLFEKKSALGGEWVQDVLVYLADRYGVEVETKDLTEEDIYVLDNYRAYRAAADLIKSTKLDPETHKDFIEHCRFREWEAAKLEKLGVGTVTSYASFRESLKRQGFTASFLDEIDLGRKDIFNEKNMIFTWRDQKGRPVGFTSRNLQFEKQKAEAEATGQTVKAPKYNNMRVDTGLRCTIFKKGSRLYGMDWAAKAAPPLYIFEGQADAVTAKLAGLDSCVAVAGNDLRTDHVFLLKDQGIYDIVLCLDGNEVGQHATAEIIQDRLAGYRDIRIRVVILPPDEDPDSFIRKNGIQALKELEHWSAFEWRLQQYEDDEEVIKICQQMVPVIVNESSPVMREQQVKLLAKRTGVTQKAIREELELLIDAKAMLRSRERHDVIERTMYELRSNPTDAELTLQKSLSSLSEIVRKHDADSLSEDDFVRDIDRQKEKEEDPEHTDTGFELGNELRDLRDLLRGSWSKDVFMAFGGKPNHGKTALLSKIAYSIATNNDDVVVIYHSIDDTLEQVVPRFVSLAEASTKLSINMIRQPHYWQEEMGLPFVIDKREIGYQKVRELAHQAKLVVKDVSHGSTLPFAENLIVYFQEKYPEKKIVYILDNIHKLRDFDGKDERVRFKAISEACKMLALRRHIVFMGSVEYTKLPPGVKPSNTNVAESVQFEYDTQFICHVYNEIADTPDQFTVCHKDVDWRGDSVYLPRVEMIVGKNKITEQKRSIFLDFFPAASDYRYVSHESVVRDAQSMKAQRRADKAEDEAGDPWKE
jgi:DNA primase catalytic core